MNRIVHWWRLLTEPSGRDCLFGNHPRRWIVWYNDDLRSEPMAYNTACDYAKMSGGTVRKYMADQQGGFVMGTPTEELEQLVDGIYGHWLTKDELRSAITSYSKALEADALRLDWLIVNEHQVWEVNWRYSVHAVTEHHAITKEFATPREAIDAAISQEATVPREGEVG